jgi:integrase
MSQGPTPSLANQDVLDFAYYSGWRRREITELTWDEVDAAGGVNRLDPSRSKTRTGRVLPISAPLQHVLARRRMRRNGEDPCVFRRDGLTVRAWRKAWPAACRQAGLPQRILHDCRRTAARNLIRAGVPERVAMLLTGHKTRCVFDRYNIVNEHELLAAGHLLVTYLNGREKAIT